jgi:hypothetical protein
MGPHHDGVVPDTFLDFYAQRFQFHIADLHLRLNREVVPHYETSLVSGSGIVELHVTCVTDTEAARKRRYLYEHQVATATHFS